MPPGRLPLQLIRSSLHPHGTLRTGVASFHAKMYGVLESQGSQGSQGGRGSGRTFLKQPEATRGRKHLFIVEAVSPFHTLFLGVQGKVQPALLSRNSNQEKRSL